MNRIHLEQQYQINNKLRTTGYPSGGHITSPQHLKFDISRIEKEIVRRLNLARAAFDEHAQYLWTIPYPIHQTSAVAQEPPSRRNIITEVTIHPRKSKSSSHPSIIAFSFFIISAALSIIRRENTSEENLAPGGEHLSLIVLDSG